MNNNNNNVDLTEQPSGLGHSKVLYSDILNLVQLKHDPN